MAELAYAYGLGPYALLGLGVRLPPLAPAFARLVGLFVEVATAWQAIKLEAKAVSPKSRHEVADEGGQIIG